MSRKNRPHVKILLLSTIFILFYGKNFYTHALPINSCTISSKSLNLERSTLNTHNKKHITTKAILLKNKYILTNHKDSIAAEKAFSHYNKKIAFLTFDDGPTKSITPKILDLLKENKVKATFFVIGSLAEKNPKIIKRTIKEGHSIGNHTYSHNYKNIYSSPENFIKEILKCENTLHEILGKNYHSRIVRFPGGSFGFNAVPYINKLKEKNYVYINWNALNGDAEHLNVPEKDLINNIKETVGNKNSVVILMHDAATKNTTVKSLQKTIDYLKTQGYEFKTLN